MQPRCPQLVENRSRRSLDNWRPFHHRRLWLDPCLFGCDPYQREALLPNRPPTRGCSDQKSVWQLSTSVNHLSPQDLWSDNTLPWPRRFARWRTPCVSPPLRCPDGAQATLKADPPE